MNVFGYVYLLRNVRNGKVYIGQTTKSVRHRWLRHKSDARAGSTNKIHRALQKYGPDAFTCSLLHQAFTREELDDMEVRAIRSHSSAEDEFGYNLTTGGKGMSGFKRTPEMNKGVADA